MTNVVVPGFSIANLAPFSLMTSDLPTCLPDLSVILPVCSNTSCCHLSHLNLFIVFIKFLIIFFLRKLSLGLVIHNHTNTADSPKLMPTMISLCYGYPPAGGRGGVALQRIAPMDGASAAHSVLQRTVAMDATDAARSGVRNERYYITAWSKTHGFSAEVPG